MFTVIIPVYNKLPHIERSINSVLNQTYSNFELILVDDASTDGSSEKLQDFDDPRVKVLNRSVPGPGGYAARNLGIEEAHNEWISFLDADDEWESDYLENVNRTISLFPNCEIISTNWDHIYLNKTVVNPFFEKIDDEYISFTLADFFSQNYFMWTSAVSIRKTLIKKAGMFPEGRCKRGGDIDAWIRCLYVSEGNIWVKEKLAHYHRETVNRVTDNTSNPVNEICSLNSIELIRQQSKDKKLLNAMDFFLAKVIYNKMVIDYRNGVKYSFDNFKLIKNRIRQLATIAKYFLRIIVFEKKHHAE